MNMLLLNAIHTDGLQPPDKTLNLTSLWENSFLVGSVCFFSLIRMDTSPRLKEMQPGSHTAHALRQSLGDECMGTEACRCVCM